MASKSRTAGLAQGLALLLPSTMSVMGVVVLAPVLPQMLAHFKDMPQADYWVPMILTTPALCVALFSAPAGWLADRFGRRRLLMLSMLLYAVCGVAPLVLDDFRAILASRVVVGVTEAAVMTLTTTLIGDYFKGQQREKWLALQTAVASISAVALFVIGGALGAISWRAPFAVYASSLLLLAGIRFFTWEPEETEDVLQHPEAHRTVALPWARLGGICAITAFAAVLFYTVQVDLSLALTGRGVTDPAAIGGMTAAASLAVPVGTIAFQRLSGQPVAMLLLMAFALCGAGFSGMALATGHGWLLASVALAQFGCGLILPTLLTWALRGLAFEIRGRATGLWQASFFVGQFLSAFVVTTLSHRFGDIFGAFLGLAIASGIAAALALGGLALMGNRAQEATAPGAR
ncbi:putative MFS family arabinose efflux permease [Nitrospirillum amazonense]|uniref:Putative MFS family arabinose efflux permease n=1 Tax=Nitrospirillum amazonense TaxID=28077 RepID=A0A560JE59_9PROT|nr:MFS transporter [Nitrospirillum amazonense]TWB69267.1 putative MFS family arabinose efflux permease [Nitrospirillum amazonense]